MKDGDFMLNLSMLNQLSIRTKILALISLLGLLVSANIGIYTPTSAKNSMREILSNDVRFIANLLADNLSVGKFHNREGRATPEVG